jgi:hypothetical protein
MGLSEHHLQKLDDGGCILLLVTYVKAVKQGDNHLKRSNLQSDTIRNYLVSAHRVFETILDRSVNIMDQNHGGKRPRLHPLLAQLIADRRRWSQPKPRYEPFTVDMFRALANWIAKAPDPDLCFLGKVQCVYDWTRLGVFTEFRIGEYGQSNLAKGQLFN